MGGGGWGVGGGGGGGGCYHIVWWARVTIDILQYWQSSRMLSYSMMGQGYYWHIAVLAGRQDAIIDWWARVTMDILQYWQGGRMLSYSMMGQGYYGHIAVLADLQDVYLEPTIYREWCMYSRGELFVRSREGYFGVYFPSCAATREINTQTTFEW